MMRTKSKSTYGKIWKGLLGAAGAFLLFTNCQMISHAETTGKITAQSAKVRAEANVTSSVVGSTAQGATVTVTGKTTDSAGMLWYEVYVDENTKGYIRSDLMEADGDVPETSGGASASGGGQSQGAAASGAESAAETPLDAQYATVTVAVAKIRSGPSTNDRVVDSLPQGSQLIVSGQSNGSDGKLWFYVTFMDTNGAERTGFVRSDLIERGEMVPVEEPEEVLPEEPQVEEEQPSGPVGNGEYEVVYAPNEDGEDVWWLYHYDTETGQGTRQKLEEVLAAAHAQSQNNDINAKTVSTQRIVIIVLIAVIIILAVVMTIMIFKLRDAYYESYEDDEEDEEDDEDEEDEEPVRRAPARRSQSAGTESRTRRTAEPEYRRSRDAEPERRRSGTPQDRNAVRRRRTEPEDNMPDREVSYEDDRDFVKPAQAPKRKAKNFLLDDDDFEFEFLNVPDKDR